MEHATYLGPEGRELVLLLLLFFLLFSIAPAGVFVPGILADFNKLLPSVSWQRISSPALVSPEFSLCFPQNQIMLAS